MACSCQESGVAAAAATMAPRYLTVLDPHVGVWGTITQIQPADGKGVSEIWLRFTTQSGRVLIAHLERGFPTVFASITATLPALVFCAFTVSDQNEDEISGYCYLVLDPTAFKAQIEDEVAKYCDKKNIGDAHQRSIYVSAVQAVFEGSAIAPPRAAACTVAVVKATPFMATVFAEMGFSGFSLYDVLCIPGEPGIVLVLFRFRNVLGNTRDFTVPIPLRNYIEAAEVSSGGDFVVGGGGTIDSTPREVFSVQGGAVECGAAALACLQACPLGGAEAVLCVAKCLIQLRNCVTERG